MSVHWCGHFEGGGEGGGGGDLYFFWEKVVEGRGEMNHGNITHVRTRTERQGKRLHSVTNQREQARVNESQAAPRGGGGGGRSMHNTH